MDERRNVLKVASFEEREWIDAWRDRRPMTDDEVLVTYWNAYGGALRVRTGNYRENGQYNGWGFPFVLAWMPKPEPYNPAEEE